MQEIMIQYGALGVSVLGLAAFIIMITKKHETERKEWKDTCDKNFQTIVDIQKQDMESRERNSSILSSLETLLKSYIR